MIAGLAALSTVLAIFLLVRWYRWVTHYSIKYIRGPPRKSWLLGQCSTNFYLFVINSTYHRKLSRHRIPEECRRLGLCLGARIWNRLEAPSAPRCKLKSKIDSANAMLTAYHSQIIVQPTRSGRS